MPRQRLTPERVGRPIAVALMVIVSALIAAGLVLFGIGILVRLAGWMLP